MPFYDTTDGPVVLEIPPADGGSITGSIDDAWQCAIADVGPAGSDAGKGGWANFILPPDYDDVIPDGYLPMPSPTYSGFALLRSNLAGGGDADIATAVEYGKRVKFYPLSSGEEASTIFVDASDVVFDATIPYDARLLRSPGWQKVQAEPWLLRDKVMIDPLKTIGIEKGQPFSPDDTTRATLTDAMTEVHAWLDALYETLFTTTFYDDAGGLPRFCRSGPRDRGRLHQPRHLSDGRPRMHLLGAFFSAKKMGAGQSYLMTIHDKDGNAVDGSATYRLTVPPNVPVTLYWSVTVYDRSTHTLIRDMPWASRSSNTHGLNVDDDGSVALSFAPAPPNGGDRNWIPTRADGKFEVLCRFYGPQQAFFDKTWRLPDIERVH